MRLLLISLALPLGFFAARLRARWVEDPDTPRILGPLGVLVASILVFLAIAWAESASVASFWARSVLTLFPIDAAVAGLVVGYILAVAIRPVKLRENDQQQPGVWAGVSLGLGVFGLLLVATMEPSAWRGFFGRVQGFSASPSGVSVSLGPAEARSAAGAIRAAAPTLIDRGTQALHGFATPRLDLLVDLTFPPATLSIDEKSFLTIDDLLNSADKSISVILGQAAGSPIESAPINANANFNELPRELLSRSQIQFVSRDRAFMLRLAQEWASTVEGPRSNFQENLRRDNTSFLLNLSDQLRSYAVAQEVFLSSLDRHVSCLRAIVGATRNQRLIVNRYLSLIDAFQSLSRHWVELELLSTVNGLEDDARAHQNRDPRRLVDVPHKIEKSREQIKGLLKNLSSKLSEFTDWAGDVKIRFTAGGPSPDDAAACDKKKFEQLDIPLMSQLIGHPKFYYAPYVALFTANLVAAAGDHAAAVLILDDWQKGLAKIEAVMPPDDLRRYASVLAWIKLRVTSEAFFIQRLSERAENPVPVKIETLRRLHAVYAPLLPPEEIKQWLNIDRKQYCGAEWKQTLVLSYFRLVKDYLDLLIATASESTEMALADFRLAEQLSEVRLDCFRKTFESSPLREFGQPIRELEQRLHFATTVALSFDAWRRSAEGRKGDEKAMSTKMLAAKAELRDAMTALERARSYSSRNSGPTERSLIDEPVDILQGARQVRDYLESM